MKAGDALYDLQCVHCHLLQVFSAVAFSLFLKCSSFNCRNWLFGTLWYSPTYLHVNLFWLIDVQEFIRSNPMQSQPLMQAILQTPSLTSLLAPNFSPNSSAVDLFVPMYDDLVRVPAIQGVDVAFTLLSKVFGAALDHQLRQLITLIHCSLLVS